MGDRRKGKTKYEDMDYTLDGDEPSSKKRKTNNKTKQNSSKKDKPTWTLLDQNRDKIASMKKNQMRTGNIAKVLGLQLGMGLNGVDSKQLSNWMNYQKKSNQLQTPSVSHKNNNIRTDFTDSCMEE
jgi:hypothetical protein